MHAFALIVALLLLPVVNGAHPQIASHIDLTRPDDFDHDGLSDIEEASYGTSPAVADTDGDGFLDGDEVTHGYDPNLPGDWRLAKRIEVDLSEQKLRYYYGDGLQGEILVSTGRPGMATPTGTFFIGRKLDVVRYVGWSFGRHYDHPNTKWNMEFIPRYFIHGTYWHNDFGHVHSKGCVNVSYKDMEPLYRFADVGTPVIIHE